MTKSPHPHKTIYPHMIRVKRKNKYASTYSIEIAQDYDAGSPVCLADRDNHGVGSVLYWRLQY